MPFGVDCAKIRARRHVTAFQSIPNPSARSRRAPLGTQSGRIRTTPDVPAAPWRGCPAQPDHAALRRVPRQCIEVRGRCGLQRRARVRATCGDVPYPVQHNQNDLRLRL